MVLHHLFIHVYFIADTVLGSTCCHVVVFDVGDNFDRYNWYNQI